MVNFLDLKQNKKELPQNIWPSAEEPKKTFFSKKRFFWGFLFVAVLSVVSWGMVSFFKERNTSFVPIEQVSELIAQESGMENKDALPKLESESGSAEKYQSENFRINHINFGGESALAVGDAENVPIEVYGVKTESFLNEKDNEAKIAVSWKSNKMTISEVTYSLADGGGSETVKEEDFGYIHSAMLPSLEEGSAYLFSIKSVDHWGNAKSFGYYGAYSSAKADSIFELIGKTFGETFGWALNR